MREGPEIKWDWINAQIVVRGNEASDSLEKAGSEINVVIAHVHLPPQYSEILC